MSRAFTLLALTLAIAGLGPVGSASPSSDPDVYALVRRLADDSYDRKTLATLYAVGDEQIDVLIRALDDPDQWTRISAQQVIRYLGNPKGMEALGRGYDAGS